MCAVLLAALLVLVVRLLVEIEVLSEWIDEEFIVLRRVVISDLSRCVGMNDSE